MHDQRSTTSSRLLLLLAGVLAVAGGCKQDADRLVPTLTWYVFDEPSGAFRETAAHCTEQAAGDANIDISGNYT